MAFEVSPAVERVAAAVRERAGADRVRLADWAAVLLEDDDGKPARLLEQVGADLAAVRDRLAGTGRGSPVAPLNEDLFDAARDRSLALRADPALTTDVLFLAVLEASPEFGRALADLGVRAADIAGLLRTDAVGWGDENFSPETSISAPESPPIAMGGLCPDVTAARVVDANLNRAREALRVVEDYCRFGRDDRALSEQTKSLRHRLAAATAILPPAALLLARDTPGDVGTTVTAGAEYDRTSPAQVAAVNLKRLQEALRSAEEFGKMLDPAFARGVEQVRYDAYTLERSLFAGSDLRDRLAAAKLYVLLTADRCRHGLERTIAEAAAGGAQVIQLREKSLSDRELLERAKTVRRLTREAGVLFVVNDRPDIARLADADGVHLGQDDLAVADARRVVGPDLLIGVSTHDIEQVRRAQRDGADYLGVGPTFPSRTKAFEAFPGPAFVQAATVESTRPAFALGGIDRHTLGAAIAAGATRVAVATAVADADDPRAAAKELRQLLDDIRNEM